MSKRKGYISKRGWRVVKMTLEPHIWFVLWRQAYRRDLRKHGYE